MNKKIGLLKDRIIRIYSCWWWRHQAPFPVLLFVAYTIELFAHLLFMMTPAMHFSCSSPTQSFVSHQPTTQYHSHGINWHDCYCAHTKSSEDGVTLHYSELVSHLVSYSKLSTQDLIHNPNGNKLISPQVTVNNHKPLRQHTTIHEREYGKTTNVKIQEENHIKLGI